MKSTLKVMHDTGLKKTPARIAILDVFHHSSKPLDADTIVDLLEKHDVKTDRVTVYRTLNTLTDFNVLKKVEFGEGKFRYELSSLPHHHHLICTSCGRVEDIAECGMEDVENKLQKRTSFVIKQHNAEFFGLCTKCQ
ncbi:transcriptional repressor [Candidatus Microgenomates bacterium]|nr:transcriptional repressor [Candidatus Microgenomates bacterium]